MNEINLSAIKSLLFELFVNYKLTVGSDYQNISGILFRPVYFWISLALTCYVKNCSMQFSTSLPFPPKNANLEKRV